MLTDLKGIVFYKGITLPPFEGRKIDEFGGFNYIDNRLHRFTDDEVMVQQEGTSLFLDGHIDNSSEIKESHGVELWEDALGMEMSAHGVQNLRGGFCGFERSDGKTRVFVDHIGNRSWYYYNKNGVIVFSTRFFFVVEVLRQNGLKLNVNEQAVKYMLTQAFMLDDTTFCEDIKRVCPGCYVDLYEDGRSDVIQYYIPDNMSIQQDVSLTDAVDGLDYYFRQAVRREFEKDREYGYDHLVDLSGGLDSRMTSWVAHDLGYTNQINLTYCKKGYLDFDIAASVSLDLGHTFFYMPLDDFGWYTNIDDNTQKLNGASLYVGSTGASRVLSCIRGCNCGIEHTGMVGDSIIGTFYSSNSVNYSEPIGNENCYSYMLKYETPASVLRRYQNKELYSLCTRGLLGAQSSYMIRQNYFETASPFLDVDFLDYILSIPFEMRVRHKLYLAWIKAKYPKATDYGWEKWWGLKPTEMNRVTIKKIREGSNLILRNVRRIVGIAESNDMNPMDLWLHNHKEASQTIDAYYCSHRPTGRIMPQLIEDMDRMYRDGTAVQKAQVLTVCAVISMM